MNSTIFDIHIFPTTGGRPNEEVSSIFISIKKSSLVKHVIANQTPKNDLNALKKVPETGIIFLTHFIMKEWYGYANLFKVGQKLWPLEYESHIMCEGMENYTSRVP